MRIVGQPRYREFLEGLPAAFGTSGRTLHSGRNQVKAFTVDGETLVAKRYRRPNIVQRVAYTFFRKGKAERAYLFAGELRRRGFDTPREIAFIETRRGGLLLDSFFVSEYCALPSVESLAAGGGLDDGAVDALAGFLASLHGRGVLHGDLNLSNILYGRDASGALGFCLIDTNRSRFGTPTRGDCVENLKRLSHDRDVIRRVAGRYAVLRGWDPDRTVSAVLGAVVRFERRRALIKGDRNLFGK